MSRRPHLLPTQSWVDLAFSQPGRVERLICWGRTVLAAFALGAIWLDPSEPARLAAFAYLLLTLYLVYSVSLLAWVSMATLVPSPLPRVAHGIDLAAAAAINYFTGSESPFFVLFVFVLLAGALRWQYRGAVWTAALALVTFIVLGVVGPAGIGDAGFELDRFLMRCGYLLVTAALLGSLGAHAGRLRHDLGRLATSFSNPPGTPRDPFATAFEHASEILDCSRMALLIEPPDEPWMELAVLEGGRVSRERLGPEEVPWVVNGELRASAFLCADLGPPSPTVVLQLEEAPARWRGNPLHPAILERLGSRSVLALAVEGELVEGWLLALDKHPLTTDDLLVGRILAQQIAALLDAELLAVQLERSATTAERMRLARDLHDGITQAISGAAFQLGSLRHQISPDDARARTLLTEIQDLLLDEHRELRLFVEELRPPEVADTAGTTRRLEQLARRIGLLWEIDVETEVEGEIPASLVHDVYRIVQEAAINAARHSGADRVSIRIEGAAGRVCLTIEDDGRGFSFSGRLELPELQERKLGPVSLKERVQALGGALTVTSGDDGSRVEILLATTPKGAI